MKIEEIKKEIIYKGFLTFERHFFRQQKNDGEWSEIFSRELLIRRNAVAVLLHDPVLDTFLFTRQFRPGGNYQNEPFIYEIVAGLIDEKEKPVETVERETKEESGVQDIRNIQLICEHYPSCGSCTEKVFLFYAQADLSNVDKVGGCKEEDEFIEVFTFKYDEMMEKFKNGDFKTSNSYISLFWFADKRVNGIL